MNEQTSTEKRKGVSIKTDWLELIPNIGTDTLDGQPINSGTMAFGMHAGTMTLESGEEIDLKYSGATIVMCYKGRECSINISHAIEESIKLGLCKKTIDFKTPSTK